MKRKHGTIGLVLAGAVARGAYEAGALSVLLPELEERGERPTVLTGTSSGALNAAFLASRADESAESATKELLEVWRAIQRHDVYRVSVSNAWGLFNRVERGFLDTRPLEKTITEALGDRNRIAYNIENGHLDALAVVATAAATSRATVFVEKRDDVPLPEQDNRKGIDYVEPEEGITPKHLMASAAVPMLFAPVELSYGDPRWFVDGGVRLNTPIKPALELGARKVVVVATNPACHIDPEPVSDDRPPDWDDAFLMFMQAAIADPLIEDMHRLTRYNTLIEPQSDDGEGVEVRGEARPRYQIPYLFVAPAERGVFGLRAAEVAKSSGLSETHLVSQILGTQGWQGKELLSYVLFEPAFASDAIDLGAEHAYRELYERVEDACEERSEPDESDKPWIWRTGPIECTRNEG